MTVNAFRPQGIDPLLQSVRERSWRVELLDRDEQSLGFIGDSTDPNSGVSSWSVQANDNSQIGLSGSISIRGDVGINWASDRLRIWESITGVGEWPLGVLMPAYPTPKHVWRETFWEVELIGKLNAMAKSLTHQSWVGDTTTPVTSLILQQLQDAGETKYSVTPTTATLGAQIIWPSATSRLTLANELASSIGFWGLRADPLGVVRSEQYKAPTARPVACEFIAGELTLLTPEWSEDWNLADVPNVVLARSQEVDGVSFEVVVEDHDPDHLVSIPSRGGSEVVEVIEGVEVASLTALQAYAEKRLADLTAPSQRFNVSHLSLPTVPLGNHNGLWVGSAVRHIRPGHDTIAVVETMHWSSDSPLCEATWRKV